MDVRSLQLPDASVDVAIDKGTLDAMIHGSLWDPPDDVRGMNLAMIENQVSLTNQRYQIMWANMLMRYS